MNERRFLEHLGATECSSPVEVAIVEWEFVFPTGCCKRVMIWYSMLWVNVFAPYHSALDGNGSFCLLAIFQLLGPWMMKLNMCMHFYVFSWGMPFKMDKFRSSVVISMLVLARLKSLNRWNLLVRVVWETGMTEATPCLSSC